MKIDVAFPTGKVYDIKDTVDINKGTKARFYFDTPVDWFANNDAVLTITPKTGYIEVSADVIGKSKGFLYVEDNREKVLYINVVQEISEPVADLDTTAIVVPK